MKNVNAVISTIRDLSIEYLTINKMKSVVIGVSGGIDSTLVCALLNPVCKAMKIPLIGLSLPSDTNKMSEIARAKMVGDTFCDRFETIYIDDVFASVCEHTATLGNPEPTRVSRGNIKAKIRMIDLYETAQLNEGLVLSTDNKTEMMLGFWTLHGDVGDFGPIQDLWKTEVYQVAEYFRDNSTRASEMTALDESIKAMATDGNGVGELGDLGQIGASNWETVDAILKNIDNGGAIDLNCPITQRHLRTAYKRNNPHNLKLRELIDG